MRRDQFRDARPSLVIPNQQLTLFHAGWLVPHDDIVVTKDVQDRVPRDTKLLSESLRRLAIAVSADDRVTNVCTDATLDRVRATDSRGSGTGPGPGLIYPSPLLVRREGRTIRVF